MTKKIEPSQSYLDILEHDYQAAAQRFQVAKKTLYAVTATAKIGDPVFENARKTCLESNKDIVRLEAEIFKVKQALRV